ncbi:glycosyltransferase family 39 protein [Patescibacteria group bacterium]
MRRPFVLEKTSNSFLAKILLLSLLLLSAWVRFQGLESLSFFTYDQARDALYIKRIIKDQQWRLIGTQSSIPGLYMGPFYYYLMSPFLALFRLNPIGLDFGIAFFSLLAVGLLFFLLWQKTADLGISLVITALYSFSPQIVRQGRFAWNPNPLPLLTIFLILFLERALFRKRPTAWIGVGMVIGVAVNCHLSTLAYLLVVGLVGIIFKPKVEKKTIFWSLLSLFFFFLPLLFFDLRHQGINLRSLLAYFRYGSRGEISSSPFWLGFWQKTKVLGELLIGRAGSLSSILIVLLLGLSISVSFKKEKKAFNFLWLLWLFLGSGVLFASFYKGRFYPYYLTFLFPVPFLILGQLLYLLKKKKRSLVLISLIGISLVGLVNLKKTWRLPSGTRSIVDLKKVAAFLDRKIQPGEKFNLVAVYKDPDRFDRNAVDYRYFLEIDFGHKVPGWDILDYQQAEIIYLISEAGPLNPGSLDFWELGLFGNFFTREEWFLGENNYLYQLIKA